MSDSFKSAFSGWKLLLAVAIGVLFSGWMLYRSFNEVQFIKTEKNKGSYNWVDSNRNSKVDFHDSKEFILNDKGNYEKENVSTVLKKIDWSFTSWLWIGAAIFFMFGRDFFYILRIRWLSDNKLSWKAGFFVIMLWEFASALSPGVVGGSAVAMFILNREKIPFGKATAMVIVTLFLDNLFFILMIPLVFLFVNHDELFPSHESGSFGLTIWFWGGFMIILTLCILLFLTIFKYPKLASRFLLFIFRIPFLKRWAFIAREWGKDIEQASIEYKNQSNRFWIKIFLATCLSWTSRYLVINAILNAFITLTFVDNFHVLGKQLVLWLFMLVSPTPGGSGVAEFAFSELLSSFAGSMILISALAILWRLISYFPYLFIGSFLLPVWIKRTKANKH